MKFKCNIIVAIIGLLILVSGVTIWFVIPIIVRQKINSLLPLPNKTIVYQEWQNTSLPIYMQFWYFSVLNKAEVENGEKPALKECGPYTYREYRVKENITFFNNGTVSYKQRRVFHFDRQLSIGNEDDMIMTINIPLVVIGDKLRNSAFLAEIVGLIVKAIGEQDALMSISVGNLTWGYVDPTLEMVAKILKMFHIHLDSTVGLFYGKNNTDDGEYLVDSGADSLNNFLGVKKWRDSDHLSFWNDEGANMINGTDGTMFPPFLYNLHSSSPLYVFQSDICRSIYAIHSSSSIISGIPAYTYTPPYAVFANHSENPSNFGFCVDGVCLGSGVLNLSTCIPGMPVVMSQPQLFQAAEIYQQAVFGLHPSDDCVTSLSIEPTTGLPLDLQKKLQINIAVEPIPDFLHMNNLPKMLLPVMWLNESVKINSYLSGIIIKMLIVPVEAATWVSIGLMILGFLIILIMLILVLICFHKAKYSVINSSEPYTQI